MRVFSVRSHIAGDACMDRWCTDFDNWAVCDTVCFHLFDRTPHAWRKAAQWTRRKSEFAKRAGYAMIWSLSVHDKAAPDEAFLACLPLIEEGARDERNFVKKAVDMSLQGQAVQHRLVAFNMPAVRVIVIPIEAAASMEQTGVNFPSLVVVEAAVAASGGSP